MKRKPQYWWDYNDNGEATVESDRDGLICTLPTMEEAQKMIADLEAGRRDPRRPFRDHQEDQP